MAVTRPALRYLGGKWVLAPRIIAHFPKHRVYVEPFGGGASVLLRKPRSYAEVYNDLDGEAVNLFRVLRNPSSALELCRGVEFTPFAREEWRSAYELTDDPVERARRMVARAFMGHGSCASRIDRVTGFRFDSVAGQTRVAVEWSSMPEALLQVAERLRGVSIECRPAGELLSDRDHEQTLFYVDPPYMHATRSQKRVGGQPWNGYVHELTDQQHIELLTQLVGLRGMVVVSGYGHPLYDGLLSSWRRVELDAIADGGRPRKEVLWINPAAQRRDDLFGAVA